MTESGFCVGRNVSLLIQSFLIYVKFTALEKGTRDTAMLMVPLAVCLLENNEPPSSPPSPLSRSRMALMGSGRWVQTMLGAVKNAGLRGGGWLHREAAKQRCFFGQM